jgi:hypothetical protein
MKRSFLLIFITIIALQGFAQKTNLIFFTEQGERFYLVLNGVRQNSDPQTNVMVTDLPAPSYKIKIIFEDTQLGEIDKNLMFGQGTETTFCIKKNNKNEWAVRYMNEVPLAQAPAPPPERYVIVYGSPAPPPPPPSTVIVSQTTTTTTNAAPVGGASVGISVNDNNAPVNINMNVSGVSSSSSSTTTSTTSTIITSTAAPAPAPVPVEKPPVYEMPGYRGPIGCPWPMSPEEFSQVKNSIDSKSFEDSKLIIAKQVIDANCLLCSQVKEIMLLFSFEDTRLELAKYAYGYTYDIGNYYRLNDAFTFESSIEELNEYINGYKW